MAKDKNDKNDMIDLIFLAGWHERMRKMITNARDPSYVKIKSI